MNIPKGQEPAFPFWTQGPTTGPETYYGITIRDWFAGIALQGILASDHLTDIEDLPWHHKENIGQLAIKSYEVADAMLSERDK